MWKDIPFEMQQSIDNKIHFSDNFIIVFWKDTSCYAALNSIKSTSYYENKITKINLTTIKGEFEIERAKDMSQAEIKTQSEFLIFPNLGNKKTWFPARSTILGVMNTLLYVTKKYTKRPTGA